MPTCECSRCPTTHALWWEALLHKYTLKACVIKSQYVKNALPCMYSVCACIACVNCTRASDKNLRNKSSTNLTFFVFRWRRLCFPKDVFPVFFFPPSQKSHALFSLILADTNKTSSITPYWRTWTSTFPVFTNWFPMWVKSNLTGALFADTNVSARNKNSGSSCCPCTHSQCPRFLTPCYHLCVIYAYTHWCNIYVHTCTPSETVDLHLVV